jgi:hypothetical protein
VTQDTLDPPRHKLTQPGPELRKRLDGDDPWVTDPRGLSLCPDGDLVYVTSGDDRVLALGKNGNAS